MLRKEGKKNQRKGRQGPALRIFSIAPICESVSYVPDCGMLVKFNNGQRKEAKVSKKRKHSDGATFTSRQSDFLDIYL
jgi:hypothetical protein